MIPKDQIIVDSNDSPLGLMLVTLLKLPRGTRGYMELKKELTKRLIHLGYIEFRGNPGRYHIQRVGDSYLYHVPINKRGHLSRFRGQLVRICVIGRGGGWIDRDLMAGPA